MTGLLDPVASQLQVARDYIAAQDLSLQDLAPFEYYIRGLLTGAPQLAGVGVIRPDGSMRRWETGRPGAIKEPRTALPLAGEALAATGQTDRTLRAAPFVSQVLGDTILNPRVGLRRDGQPAGVLVGGVTGARLSDYVARLSDETVTAFVLYDRTGLIAYPGRDAFPPQSAALPTLADSTNPVLREIWTVQNPVTQTSLISNTQGHWAGIDGVPYGCFYRKIAGYGPASLTVGVAIPSVESRLFRWSATIGAGMGGVLLIPALWVGTAVARRVAKPFVEFDDALGKMRDMAFGDVSLTDMQRSPIVELATSADRLMMTARTLARMNQYVPRALAQRLMHRPDEAARATERDLNVMFIDLEGFSRFAAARAAARTAAWLNALFATIGPAIVGNPGFAGRLNYTPVGVTVNIAERVEQRLRGEEPQEIVVIGMSEQMWQAHGPFSDITLHRHLPSEVGPVVILGPT